jgi:hypothetical protein
MTWGGHGTDLLVDMGCPPAGVFNGGLSIVLTTAWWPLGVIIASIRQRSALALYAAYVTLNIIAEIGVIQRNSGHSTDYFLSHWSGGSVLA